MSVQVFCPKCDRSCRIKEEFLGRRVRCPGCQEIFKAEEVPVADFDEPATEVLPEFTPSIPFPKVPDVDPRPPRSTDDEDDRSRRFKDDADDQPRRSKDDEEDRQRKSKVDDEARDSKKPKKKEVPGVAVGKVENPFDEKSQLAESTAAVDQSLFEFDYGDELPKKKVKNKDEEEEEDDEKPRKSSRRRDEDDRDQDTKIDEESDIDDRRLRKKQSEPPARKPSVEAPSVKTSERQLEPEPGSPFAFGVEPPPPSSKRPPSKHDQDEEDDEEERPAARRDPPKKSPVNDDADFLGLQNMDDGPTAGSEKSKPRKKERRRYFHARQSALLGEARLFRVFVQDEDLAFVTVATGKEVSPVEEALATDSIDDLDRRLRNKLADLDDLSVEELCESDRHSHRISVGKIVSAAIQPPGRKLLRKTGAAALTLEHKSKGEMNFDLPDEEDVRSAIDFLTNLLDEAIDVNVRWDKNKESYTSK